MGLEQRLESFVGRLERLARWHRPLVWLLQGAIFAGSGLGAFLLRFDLAIPQSEFHHLLYALPVWLAGKAALYRLAGLDRGWWRFVSLADATRIVLVNTAATAMSAPVIWVVAPPGFPRSIFLLDLLDFLLTVLGTAAARVATRMVVETAAQARKTELPKRVLIYGAGDAGVMLLREIRNNPALPYSVVGFVDDDPGKRGVSIYGRKVLGDGEALKELVKRHEVELVLIAMPSATGAQMTRILRLCHEAGVAFKTIPGLAEVIESNGLARQLREVRVEDLLGRSPVRLDPEPIREKLEGRVVLVTRGGGLHWLGALPAGGPVPAREARRARNCRDAAVRARARDAAGVPGAGLPRGDREHPGRRPVGGAVQPAPAGRGLSLGRL